MITLNRNLSLYLCQLVTSCIIVRYIVQFTQTQTSLLPRHVLKQLAHKSKTSVVKLSDRQVSTHLYGGLPERLSR